MNQFNLNICRIMCVGLLLVGCARDETSFVAVSDGNQAQSEQLDQQEAVNAEGEDSPVLVEHASETPATCFVHVSGAVYKPGVYELSGASRVFEAIERAGGLREDAYEGAVNQAEQITDGQMIVIPTYDEWMAGKSQSASDQNQTVDDGLVNINTADETMLCSLPGIGLSRAQAIVAYRQEHGDFQALEEIQNVTGIKAGLFSKIKDKIKLSN